MFGLKSTVNGEPSKHCAAGATIVGAASLTTSTFCMATQPLASFTYTSHDKFVKLVSTESIGVLLYAVGAGSPPGTTAYVYTPVPPETGPTVICEMSCEQNTLVAVGVKTIAAGSVIVMSSLAVHNVVVSVTVTV